MPLESAEIPVAPPIAGAPLLVPAVAAVEPPCAPPPTEPPAAICC